MIDSLNRIPCDEDVICIILGGGRGTRLFPLTRERAKPAVPIAGKYRLIDIPISNCINSGFHRIFVLTQYNSESLHRHITKTYIFDSFCQGFLEILAASQTFTGEDWYQGTADAVRKNLEHFQEYSYEYCLILGGDHLYRMDYRTFIMFLKEHGGDIAVATKWVTPDQARQFGITVVNDEGRIIKFIEKPPPSESRHLSVPKAVQKALDGSFQPNRLLASMGVYVFRRAVLLDLLANKKWTDFGRDIIPGALSQYKVLAFPFHGYWEDIGTFKRFFEVNIELTEHEPIFSFYDPKRPIYTRPTFLPPSTVFNSDLNRVILAEGCVIQNAKITRSVIGIRSVIRSGCKLEEVLMMGSDYYDGEISQDKDVTCGIPMGIGEDCQIRRAIIDKNARIGPGCRLMNKEGIQTMDGPGYIIQDGIIYVPKNRIVPAGSTI